MLRFLVALAIFLPFSSIANAQGPQAGTEADWTSIYVGLGGKYLWGSQSYFAGYEYDRCQNEPRESTPEGTITGCSRGTDEGVFADSPFPPLFVNEFSGQHDIEGDFEGFEWDASIGFDTQPTEDLVLGLRLNVGVGGDVGGEVSTEFSDFDELPEVPNGDFDATFDIQSEWMWDLVARYGVLAQPDLLLYGALGVKQRHFSASLETIRYIPTQVFTAENTTVTFDDGTRAVRDADYTATGGTVGVGLEKLLFDGRFSVGVEAFYTRYQDRGPISVEAIAPGQVVTIRTPTFDENDDPSNLEEIQFRGRDELKLDQDGLFDLELRVFGNVRFNLFN
jgi:opacity protein-like surface antigen